MPKNKQLPVKPLVIYGGSTAALVEVDVVKLVQTMRELGITDQGIANSTVYFDPKNRYINNGTHYPNWLGHIRFRHLPELDKATGEIVRITILKRGKLRSALLLNKTIIHELEHVAQTQSKDPIVLIGRGLTWGLAVVGSFIAHKLAQGTTGLALQIIGAFIGYEMGYMLAPHERQARRRAGQIANTPEQLSSTAIRYRKKN